MHAHIFTHRVATKEIYYNFIYTISFTRTHARTHTHRVATKLQEHVIFAIIRLNSRKLEQPLLWINYLSLKGDYFKLGHTCILLDIN